MASVTLPKITLNAKEVGSAIKAYLENAAEMKRYMPPNYEVDIDSLSVSEGQRGGFESITITLRPKK